MKLIGIYISPKTPEYLRKSLKDGWYPFIDSVFHGIDSNKPPTYKDIPESFFRINPTLPEINISVIVGKNGTGKSTIMEFVLMTINNFIYHITNPRKEESFSNITFIPELYTELHYELDSKKFSIFCNGTKINLHQFNDDGSMDIELMDYRDFKNYASLLSKKFFYSLSINFGLYSFNSNDSLSFKQKADNLHKRCWFDDYFHRVDGYGLPLTLIPSRNEGIIDINNETKLARQRIATIDLLLYSKKNRTLLPYYKPVAI